MKLVISLLLLAGLVCGAFAQNALDKSRLMVRDQQFQPVLLTGAKGLYVLNKGILARFDAATLELQAVKDLLAPLSALPAPGGLTPRQQNDLLDARALRLLPAAMALRGADLVALIGDQYVRVDPVSLDIKVSKPLHADPAQADRLGELFAEPARELVFAGDTLYTVHLHQYPARSVVITAVNGRDGTVLAEKPLPRPLDLPLDTWCPLTGGPTFDEPASLLTQPPCSYLAADDGVYVLRCGALAKLDPRTLAPVKVTELYGAVPTPTAKAAAAEIQAACINRAQRLLPPAMLLQGHGLVIVQGDDFFQVDTDTLTVTKHGSLTQAGGDALVARTNELFSLGAPQLQPIKYGAFGVLMARMKECYLLNPTTGICEALPLPESMTRSLPLHEKAKAFTPIALIGGEKLNFDGVLWQETGANGAAWHCFSGQYGEFILTGAGLAKLKDTAGLAKGLVKVQGVFHQGNAGANAPLGTLELTGDIQGVGGNGMVFLPGTVQKRKLRDGDVWTVSGLYAGDDYVLAGAKVKELDALPNAANRQIFIMGEFSRLQEKLPRYGQGYITLESYSFPPDPAVEAAAQEKTRPVFAFAVGENLYVLRNGVMARFACTGANPAQVHDLLPDASKIPGAEQIPDQVRAALNSERPLRVATALAFPVGNELAVLIPGAGYYRLDSSTLEEKATLGQEHYPFPLQANNTLLAAQRLYVVNSKTLLALNIADGSVVNKVELPKQLVVNLFP